MPGAGELTVIVPVATIQVGWVNVAMGCGGVGGGVLMVRFNAGEIQPSLFFTVRLYLFGAKAEKIPVVLV